MKMRINLLMNIKIKNMKKPIIILFMFLVVGTLQSCNESEDPTPLKESAIEYLSTECQMWATNFQYDLDEIVEYHNKLDDKGLSVEEIFLFHDSISAVELGHAEYIDELNVQDHIESMDNSSLEGFQFQLIEEFIQENPNDINLKFYQDLNTISMYEDIDKYLFGLRDIAANLDKYNLSNPIEKVKLEYIIATLDVSARFLEFYAVETNGRTTGWWKSWGKCTFSIIGGAASGAVAFVSSDIAVTVAATVVAGPAGGSAAIVTAAIAGGITGGMTGAAAGCD